MNNSNLGNDVDFKLREMSARIEWFNNKCDAMWVERKEKRVETVRSEIEWSSSSNR